jgi:topoisomerase IA-like protein
LGADLLTVRQVQLRSRSYGPYLQLGGVVVEQWREGAQCGFPPSAGNFRHLVAGSAGRVDKPQRHSSTQGMDCAHVAMTHGQLQGFIRPTNM